MLSLLLSSWLLWVALQVLLLLLAPLLGSGARTNGLWIVIPAVVREKLTPEELAAVIAHEQGHRARLHALENLARACVFLPRSARRAVVQELEADEWAAERGHAGALASAILKLGRSEFDLRRAARLLGLTS